MSLAFWFPSVGNFGVGLAVLGAIVSVITLKGWKRPLLFALFVGMGIGELVSIHRADQAHDSELSRQHDDVETLRREVQTAETNRKVDNAYLKAKLEDSFQQNEVLAKFAPAMYTLAQTSADFERRQYGEKVRSDKELYDFTMDVVKKIRSFSQRHHAGEEQRMAQATAIAISAKMTEEERSRLWQKEEEDGANQHTALVSELHSTILADANYARDQLLKKKLSEPSDPTEKSEAIMVLHGVMAGPYPEDGLADYLEYMAKQLRSK